MSDIDEVVEKPRRPEKPKKDRPEHYVSPDGRGRAPKVEHELNEAFAIVFRGAAGQRVLNYLRSITTQTVLAPGTHPNQITYHEGSRWLMGVIEGRIRDGEEKKP